MTNFKTSTDNVWTSGMKKSDQIFKSENIGKSENLEKDEIKENNSTMMKSEICESKESNGVK